MRWTQQPKNKWGWARLISLVLFAGVAAWMFFAALLRSMGPVPWMLWSGYSSFTFLKGAELAVVPLLAGLITGWFEDQEHQGHIEQADFKKNEQAVGKLREEKLNLFRDMLLADWRPVEHQPEGISPDLQNKWLEMIRAALSELDGKGKGELLHFLYEKKLISGESPVLPLEELDFSGTILKNVHLNDICLKNADLSKANFQGTHLVKGRFTGTNLQRANLRHTDLKKADLTGCQMNRAQLHHANLEGADLRNAILDEAFVVNAVLRRCRWQGEAINGWPSALQQAIVIDTQLTDGQKLTNLKGKKYLSDKEFSTLVDKL